MKSAKLTILIFICTLLTLDTVAFARPAIQILGASPYGAVSGRVWGKVSGGADYSHFRIVVFIKVADAWWVKPYCSRSLTPIQPDGSWETEITTGGRDDLADYIIAYLVPSAPSAGSIACAAKCEPSGIAESIAFTIYDRRPSKRFVSFAGYKWLVRKTDLPSRPAGNIFSDDPEDVWVDRAGRLHLTIARKGDRWESTEVMRLASLGRGVYMVQTDSRLNLNDCNSVTGAFTWDPWLCDGVHRELDWEISKWGKATRSTDAQFVVQPCPECPGCPGQCVRYEINPADASGYITTYIIWGGKKVEFRSYRGQFTDHFPSADFLIKKWAYTNRAGIPTPGKENFHLNLWLFGARPPQDGKRQEVVFSNFSFSDKAVMIERASKLRALPGYLRGMVTEGVEPAKYKIEVYVQVNGKWWSKPAFDRPFTGISSERTWSAPITTGGDDETAARMAVFLVPIDKGPHLAAGLDDIPSAVFADSISRDEIIRR